MFTIMLWCLFFSMAAFLTAILLDAFDKAFKQKFFMPVAIATGAVLLLAMCMSFFFEEVEAQQVGVVVTPAGVKETPLYTGLHIVAPWASVHMMDKTVCVYTFSNKVAEGNKKDADAIWTPTKDGIKIGIDLSVSWRIDPAQAPWIFQNVTAGPEGRYAWLEENIIRAKVKSAMALAVSEYTPIEVYSAKRQEIQDKVAHKLVEDLKTYHLVLQQVDIREVFYNPEYEKSIAQKKLAEQEALRLIEVTKQKEEQLKQSKIEKDIAIQKAEGEAEALKIKGSSINSNPKIIQLEWIHKWNGVLPGYMMGGNENVMLNMGK